MVWYLFFFHIQLPLGVIIIRTYPSGGCIACSKIYTVMVIFVKNYYLYTLGINKSQYSVVHYCYFSKKKTEPPEILTTFIFSKQITHLQS